MKVVWTARAVREAHEAAAYIARDKPDAADSWLDGAFESTKRLEGFPESGRAVPTIHEGQLREIVYGKSYRIIYRIGTSRILVLAVRNFAQQLNLKELGIEE